MRDVISAMTDLSQGALDTSAGAKEAFAAAKEGGAATTAAAAPGAVSAAGAITASGAVSAAGAPAPVGSLFKLSLFVFSKETIRVPLLPRLRLLCDSKLNAGHSALDKSVVDLKDLGWFSI